MRLIRDHSAQFQRAAPVRFIFDGAGVSAPEGESVAVALLRAGKLHLRDAPGDGAPRGQFCCMGLCQECVVIVNGQKVESCRLPVRAGMRVSSGIRSDD